MKRIHIAIVILSVSCLSLFLVYRLRQMSEEQTGNEVTAEPVECNPEKRMLVVGIPGLAGNVERLRPLLTLLKKEISEANVLAVRYQGGWLSNSRPAALAWEIEATISRHYLECSQAKGSGYDTIILVGYSTGALLVRRAFLAGLGETRGDAITPFPTQRKQQEWRKKVARIALKTETRMNNISLRRGTYLCYLS